MKKKPSIREQMNASASAIRGLCNMAGKEPPEWAKTNIPLKPKRTPAKKPAGAKTIPTEHQEQVAFVKWFRMQYKGVMLIAIPNAALRSVELAAYLKAEGMTAGVPDLYIPAWKTWIEFKRVKGSVISPEQKDMAKYLTGIGDRHFFAFGCDDAIEKINALPSISAIATRPYAT